MYELAAASISYNTIKQDKGDKDVLPYFPFQDDSFNMTMGIQTLGNADLIEIDNHYQDELALKNELLTQNHQRFYQALPGTSSLHWETLEIVLRSMIHDYPEHFTLTIDGNSWLWQNHLLRNSTQFVFGDPDSLALEPLDWLGRQIQEDILLLNGTEEDGMPLVAGHLCFPNAWCLDDKMAQSFLEIHQPVPVFMAAVGRSTSLLMARLKAGRPVWRANWSLMTTSLLSLPPDVLHQEQLYQEPMTLEDIGERCFVRVERQILLRLPKTNGILFTVRTYREPISAVIKTPGYAQRIARTLQTAPEDFLQYKGITIFKDTFLEYLEKSLSIHD